LQSVYAVEVFFGGLSLYDKLVCKTAAGYALKELNFYVVIITGRWYETAILVAKHLVLHVVAAGLL